MENDMIHRIKSEYDVIMLCRFGSHLYGTDTEQSDMDYKGIFMPTREQIFLGKIPKSMNMNSNNSDQKNTSEDVDCEMYSLHYFIELCCKGETAALDMLHVNQRNLLLTEGDTWHYIQEERTRFYTKSLKAFVGYARKQAAKYGLKGTRLAVAEELRDTLLIFKDGTRLREIRDRLPVNEHCRFVGADGNGIEMYQWCGKQVQLTAKTEYTYKMVQAFIDNFGERARLAKANEGIDWKAMSHAIRAAYEVKCILRDGTLEFPLRIASTLLDVKLGRLDFTTQVLPLLEDMMEEVEGLSERSTLPEKVNRSFWNEFIIDEVNEWR